MRVFITGVGAMTALGLGAEHSFDQLLAGETGVARFDDLRSGIGPGFGASVPENHKLIRKQPGMRALRPGTMTRWVYMGTAALGELLTRWPLSEDEELSWNRGVMVGSAPNTDHLANYVSMAYTAADPEAAEDGRYQLDETRLGPGLKRFRGFDFLKLMNNMPAAHATLQVKARGASNTFLISDASGLQAAGRAAALLRDGDLLEALVVATGGGCHEQNLITRGYVGEWTRWGGAPEDAPSGLSAQASGPVPGDGGAAFGLEGAEHAASQGRTPLAEFHGYATAFGAPQGNPRKPAADASALVRCIRQSLERAGIEAGDVDCIMTTASGSPGHDALEAAAYAEVFGERAVPAVALSGALGWTESAVGGLNTVVAAQIIQRGVIPPSRRSEPARSGLTVALSEEPREATVKHVLVTAFSIAGIHATAVVSAV